MSPPTALIDHLHRERILRARQSTESERLLQGAQLFDYGVEAMMAGLRLTHPNATEAELLVLVRQRLARQRQRESK